MADITLETMWHEGYNIAEDFAWWALGHNFDVVGAILAMAELSWEKGFEAGRNIAEFNDISAIPDGATVGAILFGQDSGN